MKNYIKDSIVKAFELWSKDKLVRTEPLPISGSSREYLRLIGNKTSVVAVYNCDKKENNAFVKFSRHFKSKDLHVPEVFYVDSDLDFYLQEDLGTICLFDVVMHHKTGESFPVELLSLYKTIIKELIKFQILGGNKLDYTDAYPRESFDDQSMLWDLNYFKYYFVKLAKVPFDEQLLENDYVEFIKYLLDTPRDYFLYRDFQSKNIMVKGHQAWFIDYQGGRKGALQYDLASLLYDSKADLPMDIREELLTFYIAELKKYHNVNETEFRSKYYAYVLIRIMQAMGAFGFRGFFERKKHFLESIPFAIKDVSYLIKNKPLDIKLPELTKVLSLLEDSEVLKEIKYQQKRILNIEINSFSYKRGIPEDKSGVGGGFVFDCRAIHNPGRYSQYANKTGKDADVKQFFEEKTDMNIFLSHVYGLVDHSVDKLLKRDADIMQINFGCTGGRHRSVFAAENLYTHLKNKYKVNISVNHIERDIESLIS